jgi:hypothetical protein
LRTIAVLAVVCLARALASDPRPLDGDPADLQFFETRVRPLLAEHCFSCHGDADQKAGLRLDHIASILEGGDSGPALVPGHPESSRLLHAVRYDDVELQMPPRGRLPETAVADLRKWIELGAPWPNETRAAPTKDAPIDLEARKAEHWCWRDLAETAPPAANEPDLSPIDAFVRAAAAERGLACGPEADRATLLRRVHFDLVGLPPSAEEIDSFVADPAPDAYERRVDALLASPRFGERWARHWMDLFRYAETYGHEFDYPIEEAWRYRDYLIRALAADVPYDQLVREHLAGDLLDPPRIDPETGENQSIQATAHYYFHQATHGPVDSRQDEADRIDNQIDVLTKSFLALGVSCARCHDHKFDAISTRDYYALSGYLKSSRRQIARLDPDGSIERAARRARELVSELDARIDGLTAQDPVDKWRESERLEAAAAALPPAEATRTFAAEELKTLSLAHGDYRAQEMGGFGAGRWRGDAQMWWTGGRPGDRLVLEFQAPRAGRARLEASFTKARDYAVFRVFLDGVAAADAIDGYDPNVAPTGFLSLGEHEFGDGPHRIEFEIVGRNERAAPGYMLGIDDLRWVSLAAPLEREAAIAGVAQQHDVAAERLERFATAKFSRAELPRDEGTPARPTAGFEDFAAGFGNWKESGFAFGGRPARGAADSSVLGRRFEGALRSRSFVIESDWILYRAAGERARIRVIVDGYQLDVFNALLFEDFTFTVASPDRFAWRAQRVAKYRGHRAHIELLDEGDGWLAVDEIVFAAAPDVVAGESATGAHSLDVRDDARAADTLRRDGRWLALDPRVTALEAELARLDAELKSPRRALAIEDGFGEDDYVHLRGKPTNVGPRQARRFLEALGGGAVLAPEDGSGRLALADEWLAPTNPLPARVAVNRIWHHLFGRGLVPTTDDFGKLGELPSHPELLDWLASWFRTEARWSQKALIRLIVLSRAYRASSDATDHEAERVDPQNRWLHRRSVRRLEGEAIRDAMLAISGSLDLTMYGPSVPVHLTPFMDGRGRPGSSGPLDGAGRRSVYLEVRRNFLSPFMLAFDTPLPSSTVGRRSVSNVPAQSLILMNDPLVVELARRTGRRVAPNPDLPLPAMVEAAHRAVLGRAATEAERASLVEFATAQHEIYRAIDPAAAFERTAADVCQALFTSKEFYFLR